MKTFICAVLIILATVGVYFNSLDNEFLWDDKVLISGNKSIQDWGYLSENLVTHLYRGTADASNFYRPILKLSFMLDWAVWQERVTGWHVTNIALHAINALLIFFLFGIILKARLAAFLAAMLFAVHPVFTSAVTYISGRGDPLALFFMLVSFLFFVRKRHLAGALFFIPAILTKETAIILPLLLFAYYRIIGKGKEKGVRPLLKSKRGQTPFSFYYLIVFLPYIVICAIYGALRATVFNFPFVPTLTSGSTLYLRLLTMAKILFIYLKLLILPLGLHMERNVPYVQSFFEPAVFISVTAIAVMAYFIRKKIYRQNEGIFFGISWFLIALLPVSNIRPLNMSMAEHWLYVPAIGLFACVGILLGRIMQKGAAWKLAAWGLFGAAIFFLSSETFWQNRVWRNEKVFYENFLRYVPESYVAHANMGGIYVREGETDLAIREYKKALEICPHYMAAHFSLAHQYRELGERAKALRHHERAILYFPTLAEPRYELAIFYEYNSDNVRYGPGFQKNKAIAAYKKAIGLDPGYFWPHFNLAVVYEFNEKGERYTDPVQIELARQEYEKAIALNPRHSAARNNLKILLAR